MNQEYFRLEHANPEHAKYIVVNWCLGNVCNYDCSYCPAGLHDASKPWTGLEIAKNFATRVVEHYGRARKFYFEFTGGEVSLWQDFLPLVDFLKGLEIKVGMISNGSRSLQWWDKARNRIDHLCLSYHPESAKADHFIQVVEFMSQSSRVHVNIMMLPEKFEHCVEIAMRIKNIPNLSMALQPLVVNFGSELFPYNEQQHVILDKQYELVSRHIKHTKSFEYYRGAMAKISADGKRVVQAPQRFIANSENNWIGWNCHIGLEQIVVDLDGNVYRGWCLEGGKIGNVTESFIEFPIAPVACGKTMCHCNFDIMATKERKI